MIPGHPDVRPAGRTCRYRVGHLTLPFCGDLPADAVSTYPVRQRFSVTSVAVHRLAVDTAAGNPLYLTELIRFGVATGRLSQVGGVWWWPGDTEVPPRLGELLQRRIEDVTPSAAEARDVLALGEPLPYDTLAAVVSSEAIMELDEQGIVTSDSGEGQVLLRFSHPLLFAVAARRLSPARRRALAGRLLDAPAEHVDLLRRAAWQEAAGGRPDVDLLVRASRSLIVTDPATAIRFAERAIGYDDGPAAAVTLADAQAEAGRPDERAGVAHRRRLQGPQSR